MDIGWRITVTEVKAGQSIDVERHGDVERVAIRLMEWNKKRWVLCSRIGYLEVFAQQNAFFRRKDDLVG